MRITLISPYSDIQSIGVRILAASLKQAGHQPQMVFLCCPTKPPIKGQTDFVSDSMIRDIVKLSEDAGLIGISLMTNIFSWVRVITKRIKEKVSTPIFWGGVHPTIRPEECLQYADFVCVGEGELAFPELADALEKGTETISVPGIWYKKDGKLISNSPRPLSKDLNHIPFPDYGLSDAYILDEGVIKPLTNELQKKYVLKEAYDLSQGGTYGIMTSRGCPFNCSYCGNSFFRQLYKGEYRVRRRSMENVIEELVQAKEIHPYIKGVRFHDDTFLAADMKDLEKFAKMYREKINLPFACYASPLDVTTEKLQLLCDAGMVRVGMGIQTGSSNMQKLYKRRIPNQKVLEAAKIINQFKSRLIPPWYDFIIDNPYEQIEDTIETFKLLAKLPQPFVLHMFSLVFFPGTSLYLKAREDGIITDDERQIYNNTLDVLNLNYLTVVFYCYKYNRYLPAFIAPFLSNRFLVKIFTHRLCEPIIKKFLWVAKRVARLSRQYI
jgi:radical SAM superfamily enzyme YgiQ (UPF0313 family)